jgi:hypothetical protein
VRNGRLLPASSLHRRGLFFGPRHVREPPGRLTSVANLAAHSETTLSLCENAMAEPRLRSYHSSEQQLSNLRHWRKGQSGNPAGASTRPKNLERAIRLVREAVPDAVRLVTKVMNDAEQPMFLRVRCAETLMDKGLGRGDKATNQIMLHAEQGPSSLRVIFIKPDQNYDEPLTPTIEHESVELQWNDTGTDE